ncbi:hypothetical protein CPB85DRAFT_1353169, partial [Mucidula mucida]
MPKFALRTPITLIRKILVQNVLSRARALLALQPISQADAERLDSLIALKTHELLGFPYRPSSKLLTLPITAHGFEFPSIANVNASLAVEGLVRDLNHHVPAYRKMARITLADWQCSINGCASPLDGAGLSRGFSRYRGRLPMAWISAQQAMGSSGVKLGLRSTDQSHVLRGDMSLTHVSAVCRAHGKDVPHGRVWLSLRKKGVSLLRHAGEWNARTFSPRTDPPFPTHRATDLGASVAWQRMVDVFENVPLSWFYIGSEDLVRPREERRVAAESWIRWLAATSQMSASKVKSQESDVTMWASDGSASPASAGLLDPKTLIAAVTGPRTLVMRVAGTAKSILHAEVFAQIMDSLIATDIDNMGRHRLLTDHMNSVRLVDDSQTVVDIQPRLRNLPGRSYYRWLLSILQRNRHMHLEYTKAHTGGDSIESRLNDEADHYASGSHAVSTRLPIAPEPTFFMNDYTFFSDDHGWIESDIKTYLTSVFARRTSREFGYGHKHRMATWLYDKRPPPSFPYTHAVSAYSAAVQLYARSGQLPNAETMHSCSYLASNLCRFGCIAIEDMHHTFVCCPQFSTYRADALKDVERVTENAIKTGDKDSKVSNFPLLKHAAESLFL